MLPNANRLPSPIILRVIKTGQRYRSRYISISCLLNNLGVSRFSFIVPVSVSKKSAMRNHLKRIMREAVRAHISGLRQGWDVVCMVNKGTTPTTNEHQIKNNLHQLLGQAGILIKYQ